MSDGRLSEAVQERSIDWGGIIAGAVIAAGVSVTLLAFGSGVGLAVVSTSPSWRDSSPVLWLLSGIYLVLVAFASFGAGGYAAGRMRTRSRWTATIESEFKDGMHGLCVWGLAIIITAVLALLGAAISARVVVPSSNTNGLAASTTAENVLASELDELFRSDRGPADTDTAYRRAEAARILLKAGSPGGVPSADRNYLDSLVANRAGVSDTDAGARVDQVVREAQDAVHRARIAAVLQAFLVSAALFLGAVLAFYFATLGGRDRERGTVPAWEWRSTRSPTLASKH